MRLPFDPLPPRKSEHGDALMMIAGVLLILSGVLFGSMAVANCLQWGT